MLRDATCLRWALSDEIRTRLQSRLDGLDIDVFVLKPNNIEQALVETVELRSVFERYFPTSFDEFAPNYSTVEWSRPQSELIPMLLVGQWDADYRGDREVVEMLARENIGDYETSLTEWLQEPSPPVAKNGSVWSCVSRDALWQSLLDYLPELQLESLEEAFGEVSGTILPGWSNDQDRPAFQLGQQPTGFSEALRSGLCHTLLFLGTSEPPRHLSSRKVDNLVAKCVREALPADEWRRWASIDRELPALAEACPNVFLSQIEASLRQEEDGVLRLFEESSMSGPRPHTALVWALETLAWSREHVSRIAKLLLSLSRSLGFEDEWPSPLWSLHAILHPVLPQTCLGAEERLELLSTLQRQDEELAWRLRVQLLPARGGALRTNNRPEIREWVGEAPSEPVSSEDTRTFLDGLVEQIVEQVRREPGRLPELLDDIGRLPQYYEGEIAELISGLPAQSNFDVEDEQLALEIRCQSNHFQRSSWGDNWPAIRDAVRDLYEVVEPEDWFTRAKWRFRNTISHPDGKLNPWKKEQQRAERLRDEIVMERIDEDGYEEDLSRLIDACESPRHLGASIARLNEHLEVSEVISLADDETPANFEFLRAYFWTMVRQRKTREWAYSQVEELATESKAMRGRLLRALPIDSETLDWLESQAPANRRLYWSFADPYVDMEEPFHVVRTAAEKLWEADRPFDTVSMVGQYVRSCQRNGSEANTATESDDSEIARVALNALEALFEAPAPDLDDFKEIDWEIETLHAFLVEHHSDAERLLIVEWNLRPLLSHQDRLVIYEALAQSPEFFAQLVEIIYRPDGSECDSADADLEPRDEEEVSRMRVAREVLMYGRNWFPGEQIDGSLDASMLRDWLEGALDEIDRRCHSEMGRYEIGRALGRTPEDEDGVWPPRPVREALEQAPGDKMRRGLETGRFNSQGVSSWGPQDPSPFLARAEDFQEQAEEIALQWPESAQVLRSLAASCERHEETFSQLDDSE